MTSLCQVDMKHPSLFGGGTLCSPASRLLPFGSGAQKSPATWHHCYFSCEKYQDVNLELNVDNSAFYHQFAIAQVGGVLGRKRSGHAGDGGGEPQQTEPTPDPRQGNPRFSYGGAVRGGAGSGSGKRSPPHTHTSGWAGRSRRAGSLSRGCRGRAREGVGRHAE